MNYTLIFFGSFQSYSVLVLEKLITSFTVSAVVTTLSKPAGRGLKLKPTAVEQFARDKGLVVFPLKSLTTIPNELTKPDFIVVAGYGQLIPANWLLFPKIMAVNLHPSLLPEYRGAFPAEWALLRAEKETGVTLVKMSAEFDKGEILAQQKIKIEGNDTRETLYHKLYDLGAKLLVECLPKIAKGEVCPTPQPTGEADSYFYARKITRADGFIPWSEFIALMKSNSPRLETKLRAFSGWPGVWTITQTGKRIKLVVLKPEIMIHPEGKKPISWKQFCAS